MSKNNILLIGSGFKSKVILNMLVNKTAHLPKNIKFKINNFYNIDYLNNKPKDNKIKKFSNTVNKLYEYISKCNFFFVCISGFDNFQRVAIHNKLLEKKLNPLNVLSKYCYIDQTTQIGSGVNINHNVTINSNCKIGNNVILNTSSTIDHDCIIEDGVHVMGSAAIAGNVHIKKYATIGTNSTILPNLTIGKNSIIGAGAIIRKNVADNDVIVGANHRIIKKNVYKKYKFFKF
jgi:sugar O-acyltransferase (sialic acid O-acetyltransferase NeuD family)